MAPTVHDVVFFTLVTDERTPIRYRNIAKMWRTRLITQPMVLFKLYIVITETYFRHFLFIV